MAKKNIHRLVSIGDSLTQGFQNGAVFRPDLSFPAFLAHALHPKCRFDVPSFAPQGGLPINLETLVRGLQQELGDDLSEVDFSTIAWHMIGTVNRVRRCWEGDRANTCTPHYTPYHNQAIWGAAIADSWLLSEKKCREEIQNRKSVLPVLGLLPDQAMYVTARRVLNPSFTPPFENHSMLDNVQWFSKNGGIENVAIWMGSNHLVGAITRLKIIYSIGDEGDLMPGQRAATVYRPEHFKQELLHFAHRLRRMNIDRIFIATLPYMSIPPVTRGISPNGKAPESLYFDYYTYYWIWDEEFDPDLHPHLCKNEMMELDGLIDEYNEIIRSVARDFGWTTVPLHKFVNQIAYRRKLNPRDIQVPSRLIQALLRRPETAYLVTPEGKITLNAKYLELNDDLKIKSGGIFSLDGLHPSTLGYGMMAHLFATCMQRDGVHFEGEMDWDYIISQDSLLINPPTLLKELRVILRVLSVGMTETLVRMGYKFWKETRQSVHSLYEAYFNARQ